jgi:hypothetical protein
MPASSARSRARIRSISSSVSGGVTSFGVSIFNSSACGGGSSRRFGNRGSSHTPEDLGAFNSICVSPDDTTGSSNPFVCNRDGSGCVFSADLSGSGRISRVGDPAAIYMSGSRLATKSSRCTNPFPRV